MRNEPPVRFFHQIGVAVEKAITGALADHVGRFHRDRGREERARVADLPFGADRIPKADVRRMAELLETSPDPDLAVIAAEMGYPVALAERAIAELHGLHDGYNLELAEPRKPRGKGLPWVNVLVFSLTALLAAPAYAQEFDPTAYLGQGDAYNCADFASQADAQAVLRADPLDPNRLDTDRDGIACERNPAPRDLDPVPRA